MVTTGKGCNRPRVTAGVTAKWQVRTALVRTESEVSRAMVATLVATETGGSFRAPKYAPLLLCRRAISGRISTQFPNRFPRILAAIPTRYGYRQLFDIPERLKATGNRSPFPYSWPPQVKHSPTRCGPCGNERARGRRKPRGPGSSVSAGKRSIPTWPAAQFLPDFSPAGLPAGAPDSGREDRFLPRVGRKFP